MVKAREDSREGKRGKGGGHPALLMRTSSLPCWASIWAATAQMEEGKVTSVHRAGGGDRAIDVDVGVVLRFEMGLVGFGEVRLAMKDVCSGGRMMRGRDRDLGGFGCWLLPGDLRR